MKKTRGTASLWLLVLCWLVPASASAQTVGLGYAFGAPGFVTCCGDSVALFQTGGGGEALFRDTIGVGADLAYMAPFHYAITSTPIVGRCISGDRELAWCFGANEAAIVADTDSRRNPCPQFKS